MQICLLSKTSTRYNQAHSLQENATEEEGKMEQVVPKPPEQVQRKNTNDSESKSEASEELKFPLISATAVQTFMQEHKEPVASEQPESGKKEVAGERVPEGVRLC